VKEMKTQDIALKSTLSFDLGIVCTIFGLRLDIEQEEEGGKICRVLPGVRKGYIYENMRGCILNGSKN
jgi:hypothetical protein